jgi:hypothetical protein
LTTRAPSRVWTVQSCAVRTYRPPADRSSRIRAATNAAFPAPGEPFLDSGGEAWRRVRPTSRPWPSSALPVGQPVGGRVSSTSPPSGAMGSEGSAGGDPSVVEPEHVCGGVEVGVAVDRGDSVFAARTAVSRSAMPTARCRPVRASFDYQHILRCTRTTQQRRRGSGKWLVHSPCSERQLSTRGCPEVEVD